MKNIRNKFLKTLFIIGIVSSIFGGTILTTIAQDSPSASNNPPSYEQKTKNVAYSPVGTEDVVNGVTFRSLGNGTYKNILTGQVFDDSGKVLYTIAEHFVKEGSLTFGEHGDNSFSDFMKVSVDNIDVDSKNYTATEGSVIITLGQDYIDTLAVGKHSMTCYFYSKQQVTREFTIQQNSTGTTTSTTTGRINTGNENDIFYIFIIGFGSALILQTLNKHKNALL